MERDEQAGGKAARPLVGVPCPLTSRSLSCWPRSDDPGTWPRDLRAPGSVPASPMGCHFSETVAGPTPARLAGAGGPQSLCLSVMFSSPPPSLSLKKTHGKMFLGEDQHEENREENPGAEARSGSGMSLLDAFPLNSNPGCARGRPDQALILGGILVPPPSAPASRPRGY